MPLPLLFLCASDPQADGTLANHRLHEFESPAGPVIHAFTSLHLVNTAWLLFGRAAGSYLVRENELTSELVGKRTTGRVLVIDSLPAYEAALMNEHDVRAGPVIGFDFQAALRRSVRVSVATDADVATLARLGPEAYRQHSAHIWSAEGLRAYIEQEYNPARLAREIADPESHSWYLVRDILGEALGYAKVNWDTRDPILRQPGAELQKIYFLKPHTGRGLGALVIGYIGADAREREDSFVWLDVLKTNERARRFYLAGGLVEIGERPFATDLQEIGLVVMRGEAR